MSSDWRADLTVILSPDSWMRFSIVRHSTREQNWTIILVFSDGRTSPMTPADNAGMTTLDIFSSLDTHS